MWTSSVAEHWMSSSPIPCPSKATPAALWPGGVRSPLGNGLLRVVAVSGSTPLFRLVTIVVMALFGGLLYGPRLKATVFGRYEMP